jgi:protein-S-isoprenylcysteine O-methyltransferase Ste14
MEHDLGSGPVLIAAGLLLVTLGLLGLIESFGRFALEGRATPAPVTPARQLIVTGLYRFVRNPMYVSVVAVIVGQALVFSQIELIAYAALLWVAFHLFVILYEEPAMRRLFPGEYATYSKTVPRWLPLLRPSN